HRRRLRPGLRGGRRAGPGGRAGRRRRPPLRGARARPAGRGRPPAPRRVGGRHGVAGDPGGAGLGVARPGRRHVGVRLRGVVGAGPPRQGHRRPRRAAGERGAGGPRPDAGRRRPPAGGGRPPGPRRGRRRRLPHAAARPGGRARRGGPPRGRGPRRPAGRRAGRARRRAGPGPGDRRAPAPGRGRPRRAAPQGGLRPDQGEHRPPGGPPPRPRPAPPPRRAHRLLVLLRAGAAGRLARRARSLGLIWHRQARSGASQAGRHDRGGRPVTTPTPSDLDARAEAFAEQLFGAALGTAELTITWFGRALGLYDALRGADALSAPEVAARAGVDARYAREWLEHQAVAGILTVDDPAAEPDERRYTLPEAHAAVLLDEEHPFYSGALADIAPVIARSLDLVADAFRTGAGVPYAAYGFHGMQAGFTRPMFANSLVSEWVPALPDVQARLDAGEALRIVDIGC